MDRQPAWRPPPDIGRPMNRRDRRALQFGENPQGHGQPYVEQGQGWARPPRVLPPQGVQPQQPQGAQPRPQGDGQQQQQQRQQPEQGRKDETPEERKEREAQLERERMRKADLGKEMQTRRKAVIEKWRVKEEEISKVWKQMTEERNKELGTLEREGERKGKLLEEQAIAERKLEEEWTLRRLNRIREKDKEREKEREEREREKEREKEEKEKAEREKEKEKEKEKKEVGSSNADPLQVVMLVLQQMQQLQQQHQQQYQQQQQQQAETNELLKKMVEKGSSKEPARQVPEKKEEPAVPPSPKGDKPEKVETDFLTDTFSGNNTPSSPSYSPKRDTDDESEPGPGPNLVDARETKRPRLEEVQTAPTQNTISLPHMQTISDIKTGFVLGQAQDRMIEYMEKLFQEFWVRNDGAGDVATKMYWLIAGEDVIPDNQPYIFGKYVKYTLRKMMHIAKELEELGRRVLEYMGIYVNTKIYGPYTVVCRYGRRQGVGIHRDNDYNTEEATILSMSLGDTAIFCLEKDGEWKEMRLQHGSILIFDRMLRHKALGTEGSRINITMRWVRRGQHGVFK